MATSPWKAVERAVADVLREQWRDLNPSAPEEELKKLIARVPVSGRQRGFAPDILHPVYAIEVKHRKKLPKWLIEAAKEEEYLRTVRPFEGTMFFGRLKHLEGLTPGHRVATMTEKVFPKNLPGDLADAFDQVVKSAEYDNKRHAIVVMHQLRMKAEDSIVFLLNEEGIERVKNTAMNFALDVGEGE